MNKEELKQKILNANKAYREGKPIISDIQFDELVEKFQTLVSEDEYNEFRDSLHEVAGKVKHPFVMGSLDKLKAENDDDIKKFIDTYVKSSLHVSAKVDGISCRLHYENGKLISASTRGDGYFGESLTDKIIYVKNVPSKINSNDVFDIRGELVIFKDDFAKLEGFANARNACAGIMNKKYWDKEEIENVSFVAYTILGSKYTKNEQFFVLNSLGFKCSECTLINNKSIINGNISQFLSDIVKKNEALQYETDGLVICDANWKNEDEYRPDACKAFKVNQLIATTKVIDVAFEGPSKDGFFIPVAILEPVQLGGSVISRVTLHNLDVLEKLNLDFGDTIEILKSGDIIPRILRVVKKFNISEVNNIKNLF